MKNIEFIEDFATKKKGDKWTCDAMLASQLVFNDKVAIYVDTEEVVVPIKKSKTVK